MLDYWNPSPCLPRRSFLYNLKVGWKYIFYNYVIYIDSNYGMKIMLSIVEIKYYMSYLFPFNFLQWRQNEFQFSFYINIRQRLHWQLVSINFSAYLIDWFLNLFIDLSIYLNIHEPTDLYINISIHSIYNSIYI